jgi:acetyl esterase/lipase
MVTPVTFRVRKRHLRGILAEFDSEEKGYRELSGEWVVGKATWQRLQAEWKAAHNRKVADSSAKRSSSKPKERVIFYIHGGAYYISSAAVQRLITIPLAKYTDARVFALDYRLAPETCFPGPLHDVVSGYLRLVEDLHIPPENIIVAGDSAGGGLSLALLLYLRDNDYPLPSAGILMSPWVDLTMSCHSWEENKLFDIVPRPESDDDMNPVSLYLGDLNHITHPYASPLFGDMEGLPPLLISAGDAEVLRDEISLLAHKAKLAGVEVQHELYEDAVHVFQVFPFLEASTRSFLSIRNYVHSILPRIQSRSPQQIDGTAERELEHEIDNDQARVVSGDGVETASGRQEAMGELKDANSDSDRSTQSDTEEDTSLSENELPSWGRSRQWSPPKGKDIEGYDSDSDLDDESFDHPLSIPPSNGTETAALRRIQSAISIILPNQESLSAAQAHHHKRTLSHKTPDNIGSPTSPSVRHNSHPDIASLVQQWTNTANQTLMCKPHQYSRPA